MKQRRPINRRIAAVIIGLPLACLAFYQAGLRVNTTASIPLGIYRMVSSPGPVAGDLVMACPLNTPAFVQAKGRGYLGAGPCPSGISPIMKRLEATAGDVVAFTSRGVIVNGELVKNSGPLAADLAGRPMPELRASAQPVPPGQVLLMGIDNPKSFDGRYYGLIPANQITAVIRPIVTWKD